MAPTLQAPGELTASLLGRPGPRHASITFSLRSRLRGPGCKTHPRHVGTVGASDSLSGASVNPPFKWDHSPDPWAGEGPVMSWVGACGQGPGVGGSQRAGGVLCLGPRATGPREPGLATGILLLSLLPSLCLGPPCSVWGMRGARCSQQAFGVFCICSGQRIQEGQNPGAGGWSRALVWVSAGLVALVLHDRDIPHRVTSRMGALPGSPSMWACRGPELPPLPSSTFGLGWLVSCASVARLL